MVYLWGGEGSGRTHLLQAACHTALDLGLRSVYLPLDSADLEPSILQGLEAVPLICLDNIHSIADKPVWQEAVFHFFNRLREKQGRMLVAADNSPLHLPFKLADLQSRLSWGTSYQLQALNDDEKLQALQLRASLRGLELDESVARFLLRRYARGMRELFGLLDKLDKASLAEQRRLTIPFVKTILSL